MNVAGVKFELVSDITAVRNMDGSVLQFLPQDRYLNARGLSLNNYGAGPFCKFSITNKLPVSGVYIIVVNTEIMYVGECANLSARFNSGYGNISPKNCYKGGQETNCRINNMIYSEMLKGKCVSLRFFKTDDYKKMEITIRATSKFAWNRV